MADDDIQVTEYGGSVPGDQPGGQTYDYNSYHGIGDRDNQLVKGLSVALTPEERLARFGTSGKSTGLEFEYQGKTYRDDDTAAQEFHGHDEGKRIDVYEGGGAASSLARVGSEGRLGPENLLASSGYDFASEPDIQASTPLDLRFDTTEEESQAVNEESPYQAWKRNNPLLAEVTPKSQVLSDMHKSIAPEMDQDRFNYLAQSPAGYQAIKNIQSNVSPLQQWRKDHPEFAFYDDEDISRDTYNKMVAQKRIDPAKYDYDAFKMVFNPPNPVMAATYNFLRGLNAESSSVAHQKNRSFYSSLSDFNKMFNDILDTSFPDQKSLTGKDPNAPGAGTKLATLEQQMGDWIQKNTGIGGKSDPIQGLWNNVSNWLGQAAQWQSDKAKQDQERAEQAGGVTGEIGRQAGAIGTGLIYDTPLYAAFGQGGTAAILSSTYLGTSRYGDAIQAHEDNALEKGFEAAATGPLFGYMMNSPIGRLKTGFLNFALNSGQDEMQKMMKGEKSNWSEFAEHSGTDILLGVLMGKSTDKGPYVRAQEPSLSDLYYEPKTRPDAPGWQVEVPRNGGLPPAAHDAMMDALDARARGDYQGAAEALDKAMSILSPKERQDVASRVKASVKSQTQPSAEAAEKHDDHYFGVSAIRKTSDVPHGTVEGFENEDFGATVNLDETGAGQTEPTSPREDQAPSAESSEVSGGAPESHLESAINDLGGAEGTGQKPLPARQAPHPNDFENVEDYYAANQEYERNRPGLVGWARRVGKVLNLDDLTQRLQDAGYIGRGAYHRVYRNPDDPGRVIKTRAFDPDEIKDQQDQLRDYHYMNEAFGSDIKLEGVATSRNGNAIITSMPFIEGTKPSPGEIEDFMKSHGFIYEGNGRWENQKLGIWADDAHEGNLVKTPDGRIVPIDLMMGELNKHPLQEMGPISAARKLGVDTGEMLKAQSDSNLARQEAKYRADLNKREKWLAVVQEQMRRDREGGGHKGVMEANDEGPVSVARRIGVNPAVWVKAMSDSELKEQLYLYQKQVGKNTEADIVFREIIRRRQQRGEGGFIVIPGADRIKQWFEAGLAPFREFGDWWHVEFDPEKLGPGAARAGNIARRENVLAAGAEDLRNWIALNKGVDVDLRGAQKIMRRRNEFNELSDDQLKQMLIAWDDNKPIKVPNKAKQGTFDALFKLYKTAYKGMADIEKRIADFGYSLRENYMYHAIKDKDRDRFQGWLQDWAKNRPGYNPDPRFTKMRELPTWREVFAAGFEPKSYNFEDLFQMRLNSHTEALKRIRELRQLKDLDLALLKNPKEKDIQQRMAQRNMSYDEAKDSFKIPDDILHGKDWWDGWRAPNGEQYVVEKNAGLLLRNAWDQNSFYTSANVPLRWYFKGMSALKGVGANILTWSMFHPKHILFTSLTNYTWDWVKAAATGKPWNAQEAWNNAIKAVGAGTIPELDYFQNKRPITSLSQEQLQNVDAVRWMGLNFGINHERAMQWNFARQIAEEIPKLRQPLNAANKLTGAGFKWLTLQPVQEWMFGKLIPHLKMADALRDHALLLKYHPEYLDPAHAEEYHTQLAAIGKATEAKYGEMFLDNLFWKKTTKEIFTAHLLSLGWQLSAIRVYAGGAKDLLDNSAALMGLRKKAANPQVMGIISDRMGHLGTYLGMYMLTNAAISWVNGYSQGKSYESKDLWFPVIGKNPPGSPDPWIRAAPGEFNRELAVLLMHIKAEGGGAMGAIYGTANYATNKLQPVASSMKQAFIDQKNYFGADIGGEPADDDISRIADKMEYVLANSTLPIPFKSQLQAKPGQTEGVSVGGFVQDPVGETKKAVGDILQWPTLWSMMGYPQAGAYVGRSDTQNLIATEYGKHFGGGTKIEDQIKKTQAYEQYRIALAGHDRQAIDAAVENIEKLGKEQSFNPLKAMEGVRTNALKGITADQYMFSRFDRKTQDKILRRATPDERAQYEKFLHHE